MCFPVNKNIRPNKIVVIQARAFVIKTASILSIPAKETINIPKM